MQQVTIAFDIDGTLRDNTITDGYVANERIRTLLITLASMKNTRIMLWSGGRPIFHTDLKPDIAFDDIEECSLGGLNLIVQERGFTPGYVPPEQR